MKKLDMVVPWILQKVGYVVFFVLYKIFIRIEIKGVGELEGYPGPFIFAMNHTHELDATTFPLMLPFMSRHFPLVFVAASQERYKTFGWRGFLYGGKFFNALGAFSVFSGQQNYAYALQTHERFLKQGYSVCIFPEGKRTEDGELGPARGGLGYLAYVSKAAVVPVAINTFYKMTLKDFFLRKRKVVLVVGTPLSLVINEPTTKESFTEAGEKVMREIDRLSKDNTQ